MTKVSLREQHAHRQSVAMSPADVARYLADVFGQRLVAHMAGVNDADTVRIMDDRPARAA